MSNIPLMDTREMPLLRSAFTALLDTHGVFREALFMLFRLRGILGVAVAEGVLSGTVSSVTGDGVLMRDTEKRPVDVRTPELQGVWNGVTVEGLA